MSPNVNDLATARLQVFTYIYYVRFAHFFPANTVSEQLNQRRGNPRTKTNIQ
jgi:hypothetical protein